MVKLRARRARSGKVGSQESKEWYSSSSTRVEGKEIVVTLLVVARGNIFVCCSTGL